MEQLRAAHANSLQELQTSHADALETAKKSFEKQIAALTMDLNATREDLNKSKNLVATCQADNETYAAEIQRLKQEAETGKEASASNTEKDTQIAELKRQLTTMADDLDATNAAFTAQKESLQEMIDSHQRDLEEAAKSRVEAIQELKKSSEEDKAAWAQEKAKLVQDLEDERVAKEQAKAEAQAAQTALQTPPMSPKANGEPSQMVAREDLRKVHEAHTAKMAEVEANHNKAVQELRKEIGELKSECGHLRSELDSKDLELKFMGDEKQELEDEIEK
jgi:conserved oligomeric Golgi complex subunit 6